MLTVPSSTTVGDAICNVVLVLEYAVMIYVLLSYVWEGHHAPRHRRG